MLKIAIISLIVGVLVGYFALGPKIITETTETERIVRDTVIIEHPDGTKETRIKDRIDRNASSKESIAHKDWLIVGGMTLELNRQYQLSVNKRILGNIYVGGFASTTGSFGVSLGMTF